MTEPLTTRVVRELEIIKASIQSVDRDQQQRLALFEERVHGRLALIEQSIATNASRLADLEGGKQWVIRTIGGVAIGAGITAIWALGGLHH